MKLPAKIVPYNGVIYFVVILLASHFFWKFTVLGDESDTLVTFFGLDISAPFNYLQVTYRVLPPTCFKLSALLCNSNPTMCCVMKITQLYALYGLVPV